MHRKFAKHIVSWSLLLLFVYNVIGCYATFFIWKIATQEHLEEIASSLPDEQLTLITFSKTTEIENEITVNGKQYDVIRTKQTENKIYCYCLRDFTEEQMNTQLNVDDNVFNKALNDLSKAIKSLQKNASEKFVSTEMNDKILFLHLPIFLFKQLSENTLFLFFEHTTPPPQI